MLNLLTLAANPMGSTGRCALCG